MTVITRSTTASLDANQARQTLCGNIYAGEDLDAVAPCYIKSSDGKIYMCDGTTNNEAAEFIGFTARAVDEGEPVTLYGFGSRFKYSTGLTPGQVLYIANATAYVDAGNLDTAATTGDSKGTVVAVTATDIVVTRTNPLGG